ncbi:demethoxyubiquinone hydroxylase family protein [Candidatus Cyrtobacter comes]|uniref:demethoxyubiquinone hydroxylase family protein n=1 Tax=Candidatus Cyrtobacter comes TaxID=675776 RepID=UPI002ACF0609|nr:demethoxyubiquinone hydroxylase family protein [Candidatus Cyrtobacter comes]
MIRVNHAGEYGAKRIYEGQLKALSRKSNHDVISKIQHMKEQELTHLNYFEDLMIKNGARPSIFHNIWHIGAFGIGFVSAFLGKNTAMACTSAVEEVIDEHYQEQIKILKSIDKNEIADTIEKFRLEELEHKKIGDSYSATGLAQIGMKMVTRFITKTAILISKRV